MRLRRIKAIVAFSAAAILLIGSGAFFLSYLMMGTRASVAEPSPAAAVRGVPTSGVNSNSDSDADWPCVDWDYWQGINKDIIGWISIPGTDVSYPVCQAPASEPQFYLDHDVYGSYNVYGCPYLDANCEASGLASGNAVIFGHHMIDGSMFATVSGYSGQAFLDEHPLIYLQTPAARWKLSVAGGKEISGSDPVKKTEFADGADFLRYLRECLGDCTAKSDIPDETISKVSHMVTLCTCSYGLFGENGRTLAYAVEVDF